MSKTVLAIYIAIGLIPVIMGPAGGQGITLFGKEPLTPPVGVLLPATDTTVAPARELTPVAIKPLPETVVIAYGRGGSVHEHIWRFSRYRNAGARVEIRGPCLSACTLVLAYVGKADICIGEGAFMAFHAVRTAESHKIMPAETGVMYYQQPEDIRGWIDRHGGWQKLPLDGFWTMYDRELWALGYPKCQ